MLTRLDETCWTAKNSRLDRERFTGKRVVAVFATVRKEMEGQRLNRANGIFFCHAIAHASGKVGNFRNPAAIVFTINVNP